MEIIISLLAVGLSAKALMRISSLREEMQSLKIELDNIKSKGVVETNVIQNNVQSNSLADKTTDLEVNLLSQKDEERVDAASTFVAWLKHDWLIKLGGILVFMGVMFFLSIAFAVIGPVGKIIVGYLIGIALAVFGFKWANKNVTAGMSINLIGSLIVLFTTYMARTDDFNLFSAPLANLVIFAVSLYISFCAYRFKLAYVAHIGLAVAGLLPLLTNTEYGSTVALFSYLLVIVAGTIWLANLTNWRSLILLSQIIVLGYSATVINTGSAITLTLAALAITFGVVFFVTSITGILLKKDTVRNIDIFVALLNIIYASYWINERLPEDYRGLAFLILALVNIVSVYYVYTKIKDLYAFMVYGGSATILLMTATVILAKSNSVETIILLTEVAFATYATYKLSNNTTLTAAVAVAHVYPFISVFESINRLSSSFYSINDFSVTIYAFAILVAQAYLMRKDQTLFKPFLAGAIGLGLINIWQVLHALLNNGLATFISLLIYTLIGLSLTWYGYTHASKQIVKFGRFALGAIAIRIIFVDAWSFDNALIGVFICIIIGVLLLSTTVISKKYEIVEN